MLGNAGVARRKLPETAHRIILKRAFTAAAQAIVIHCTLYQRNWKLDIVQLA